MISKISVAVVIFPVQCLFPRKPGLIKQKKARGGKILENLMSLGGEKRIIRGSFQGQVIKPVSRL